MTCVRIRGHPHEGIQGEIPRKLGGRELSSFPPGPVLESATDPDRIRPVFIPVYTAAIYISHDADHSLSAWQGKK